MLKDLTGVDNVKSMVGKAQFVRVANGEAEIPPLGRCELVRRRRDYLLCDIDPDHLAVADSTGQFDRDAARSTTNVQK